MQEGIEARLAAAGYDHYEVSAYAKLRRETIDDRREAESIEAVPVSRLSPGVSPAWRCAHNLNYWTFGDYLGIGAGAHGKLSFPGRITREARVKHPERYLEAAERGAALQEEHEVGAEAVGFEFMMNALRLNEGFPARLFEERAGLPLARVLRALEEAERRGLIERDHERIAPTSLGRRFLNDLLQIFLAPGRAENARERNDGPAR
jgi:oxygen-independent coproporphyrinogen-3 oxidase